MVSTVKNLLSSVLPKAAVVAASTLLGGLVMPVTAQTLPAQSTESTSLLAQAESDAPTRSVGQANSPIGIAAGRALMSEAEGAIAQQNYTVAAEKLVAARKALNEVSTFYQNLSGVFVGIDNRVNSDLRALALDSAQVRDQASYQLAVVYRAQNRPDLAVPLLVEVVQSQQPTRELGQQAYQQLFELGFVGVAYDAPATQPARSSSDRPAAAPAAPATEPDEAAPAAAPAAEPAAPAAEPAESAEPAQ
jgi:hypothetical protein